MSINSKKNLSGDGKSETDKFEERQSTHEFLAKSQPVTAVASSEAVGMPTTTQRLHESQRPAENRVTRHSGIR
jgi:hypothetical protein